MEKIPNKLIKSSSPYLLQHAYNPVEWQEWNNESLALAQKENKLLLVSIGYSACHWCHVMEHESFENFEVAEVMNQHFINIKIDREERPDIDQIYMYAVQLMRGNGGWPLNCICLPNGKPIYGGTYFNKADWMNILSQLAKLWQENPKEAEKYAEKLTKGIQEIETIIPKITVKPFHWDQIESILIPWKRRFDLIYGGYNAAPKFPLPNNWLFLLKYAAIAKDDSVHIATLICLQKMALGGIYDAVGGGFARYSVDERWHIPHFEKMLYDNAQLISLYAEAYLYAEMPLFKQVVTESIDWVFRELYAEEGLFYAALDADSEGVEGKFYVWQWNEIQSLLPEKADLFCEYYGINEAGNWQEEKTNVLMAIDDDESFAVQKQIPIQEFKDFLFDTKKILLAHRNKRIKPGLDYKIIISWNALMIKALVDAYKSLGTKEYLQKAILAAEKIVDDAEQGLSRIYKKPEIKAFLEDYAFLIEALIALYEASFDEKWLQKALFYTEIVLAEFSDDTNGLFYFTSKNDSNLIARKQEITDNVIPSSNSVMAHNLQKLSKIFQQDAFEKRYQQMLVNTQHLYASFGSAYSNWAMLLLDEITGCHEIALSGNPTEAFKTTLFKQYIPFKIYVGKTPSEIPLLKDKHSLETKLYICKNKTCSLPFNNIEEAIQFINKGGEKLPKK